MENKIKHLEMIQAIITEKQTERLLQIRQRSLLYIIPQI